MYSEQVVNLHSTLPWSLSFLAAGAKKIMNANKGGLKWNGYY